MSRTRRRPGPTAFRAAPVAVPAARPTRRQALALLAVLVLVTATVAAMSYLVRPDHARSFDLFSGSVFLADSVAPVGIDLASGRPTVRLIDANTQVGAGSSADLAVTPTGQGAVLLNRRTGEFNLVASTGFVVKTDGGVPLAARAGSTGSVAVASGDLAYIEQTGPTGTSVYLVGQTTVETASTAGARARPRAFRAMPEPGSTDPGAAASADGDLWLLVGGGSTRTLRQLHVPAGSSTGATLASSDHGSVTGPAALATASAADTPSTQVVALASADRIEVLRGGAVVGTARFPAVAGLDQVEPASGGQGRLSFLLHGTAGWSVVSVGADGRDVRGPTALASVPASAQLITPAVSQGSLYTMDATSGQLLRITAGGAAQPIDGAASYPLAEQNGRVVEPGGFTDAYVLSRGPRVIYNSPNHLDALVLFTDGSRPPLTVEKSSAVAVSAAGGADALTRSRVDAGPAKGSTPKPTTQPKPSSPVNNKIDCTSVRQKPHIPTIVGAVPGSRSVALTWTYPLLSPQDCVPSTYQVQVQLLSADAPSPPSAVDVQGQQSVNLAGLFPNTQYQVTVTAFINGQGTASTPRRITTGPEGPAAPKGVTATTDAAGDWSITWSSCGSAAKGCVPASSWTVIPQFCDGLGLSGTPSPITVTADPTSIVQPPATLRGGSALLGRGLRFQVEGTGLQGTVGTPSAATACTYSWAPPNASQLSLHASTKPLGSLGSTTSATVTLDTTGDAVAATGGVGAQITYTLQSGGSTVRTVGPTTATTATFDGINAGQQYTAKASVAPPRHPEAAVTVGPIDVTTPTAPWPTITAQVGPPVNDGGASANVTIQIGGLTSAAADNERFALVNSALVCGNAAQKIDGSNLDPADPITVTVARLTYNGPCKVTVQLTQDRNLTTPPLFGDGTTSNAATSNTFTIDPPTLLGVSNGDFSAAWDGSNNGQSLVKVTYTGGNPLFGTAGNFSVSVTDPDGTACGGYNGSGSLQDVAVTQSCVDKNGASGAGWKVTVAFNFLLQGRQTYTVTGIGGGQAPTYTPPVCDVTAAGLGAAWTPGATVAKPTIDITANDGTKLKNCGTFSYKISSPKTADCGTASGAPPVTASVSCSDAPSANDWTVTVTYQDVDGSTKTAPAITVTGTPPT